jgi:protein gp37
MGQFSWIEWTNATWNPWRGCHKVSQGCKNCYMFRDQERYGHDPNVVVRSKTTFNDPLKWTQQVRPGATVKVFTCSWSDWFIQEADPWRAEAWEIVRQTPNLIYQILTKRPENIASRLPADWGDGYPNVWLGVSAEDQANADKRIPILLQTPARVRFVSAEPLIGLIDMLWVQHGFLDPDYYNILDWVIVGGESGPGHRPMELDWARSIVEQCQAAGVACFVKQLGGWPDKRGDVKTFPPELQVRQFPGEEIAND